MLIVLRLNHHLGIPDKVFYVLGEAILESVVGMLYYIPSSAIISKVVSHNMEASQYAFLAGMSNFAGAVAQITGALIFDWAGVKTDENTKCNFGPLWWLILCFHIILPLIVGVGAAFLIPNVKQTDKLLPDGSVQGTVEVQENEEDVVPFIDY